MVLIESHTSTWSPIFWAEQNDEWAVSCRYIVGLIVWASIVGAIALV